MNIYMAVYEAGAKQPLARQHWQQHDISLLDFSIMTTGEEEERR
jgi:hypothetical protein